jgi:hypothetical protein
MGTDNVNRLEIYFGPMFLDEIDESAIDDYRDARANR